MAGLPNFGGDHGKKLGGFFAWTADSPVLEGNGAKVERIVEETAHTVEESIAAVPKLLHGVTMRKGYEGAPAVPIEKLNRPAVAIVGGGDVVHRREQMEWILDEIDVLVLGGELIFAFYKAQGLSVGSTPVPDEDVRLAKSIMDKAKAKGVKLVLPTHVVVADGEEEYANTKIVGAAEIPDGWIGVDVGPATMEQVADALKGAKAIVWNGDFGRSMMGDIEKLIEEDLEKDKRLQALLLGEVGYVTI